MFVEGCTTNGRYLIKFKKGAFASLKPVKPYINRSQALVGDSTRGNLMSIWLWSFLVPFMNVLTWSECLEMPVFAPNDYFWKHHWDGKDPEARWEVFANAVREAMAECGGYKLSDAFMEDKMTYKELVWGKAGKAD